MKFKIKSPTSGRMYTIDTLAKTCDCMADNECSHLKAVGAYKPKSWRGSINPSYAQALSAMIKSIRIRNVEEAMYWLIYLVRIEPANPGARFRLVRRLLIATSEDGFSLPLMQDISESFNDLMKGDLFLLADKLLKICKPTPWWNSDSNGKTYLEAFLVGERNCSYNFRTTDIHSQKETIGLFKEALESKDMETACTYLSYLTQVHKIDKMTFVEVLIGMAKAQQDNRAMTILAIHKKHKVILSEDWNFIGQGIFFLCGMGFNGCEYEDVYASAKEVHDAIAKAKAQWKTPHVVPYWGCDGVHCAGADRRYCGMLVDMVACCNAFEYYGNVGVENKWRRRFYTRKGLVVEPIE